MNTELAESKHNFFLLSFFLLGIFVLAIGAGLYFFGGAEHKESGVRIISATDYAEREIKNDSVLGVSNGALVDINTATQAQLEDLPGVGPVTALKIIAGRPYNSLEELLVKKAVGRSLYEKISLQITVGE